MWYARSHRTGCKVTHCIMCEFCGCEKCRYLSAAEGLKMDVAVSSSTWFGFGTLTNLDGDSGQKVGSGADTAAYLVQGTAHTSNAFDLRELLQQQRAFEASYQIYCDQLADAIYFYFGGTSIPLHENDLSSGAFIISLSIYNNVVAMKLQSPIVDVEQSFNPALETWLPVVIRYHQNFNGSFTVFASISTLDITTTVENASGWLNPAAGSHWGIGARAGGLPGYFVFRMLQVDQGPIRCSPFLQSNCSAGFYSSDSESESCLPCLAGSFSSVEGATSADECTSCQPGTFADLIGPLLSTYTL